MPTGGTLRGIATALTVLLLGTAAEARTGVVVAFDAGVPAIRFAASDLVEALKGRGFDAGTVAPGELAGHPAPLQIVITTVAAPLPGMPAVHGLGSQAFALHRTSDAKTKGSRWWAIGGDAAGAMYAAARARRGDPDHRGAR
jgi:hypothetical protein